MRTDAIEARWRARRCAGEAHAVPKRDATPLSRRCRFGDANIEKLVEPRHSSTARRPAPVQSACNGREETRPTASPPSTRARCDEAAWLDARTLTPCRRWHGVAGAIGVTYDAQRSLARRGGATRGAPAYIGVDRVHRRQAASFAGKSPGYAPNAPVTLTCRSRQKPRAQHVDEDDQLGALLRVRSISARGSAPPPPAASTAHGRTRRSQPHALTCAPCAPVEAGVDGARRAAAVRDPSRQSHRTPAALGFRRESQQRAPRHQKRRNTAGGSSSSRPTGGVTTTLSTRTDRGANRVDGIQRGEPTSRGTLDLGRRPRSGRIDGAPSPRWLYDQPERQEPLGSVRRGSFQVAGDAARRMRKMSERDGAGFGA